MTAAAILRILKAAGGWMVRNWQIVLLSAAAAGVLWLYVSWSDRGETIREMQACIDRRDAIIDELKMVNVSWVEQAQRWTAALKRYKQRAEQYEADLETERNRRRRAEAALRDAEERISAIDDQVTSEDCDTAVRELAAALGWAP